MGINTWLRSIFGGAERRSIAMQDVPELVYIYLPEPLDPEGRGVKYEDFIASELERLEFGQISGGGSQLGEEDSEGNRAIEFCGIDIDTDHVERTRILLHHLLPKLGCLQGTQLHYRTDERPLLDEFDGANWILAQHRSMLHPGFGI